MCKAVSVLRAAEVLVGCNLYRRGEGAAILVAPQDHDDDGDDDDDDAVGRPTVGMGED